jgi:hypothetical protein
MRAFQPGSVLGLWPMSSSPGAFSTEIADARSITLIIHGIGYATHNKLLTSAVKGYDTSRLGGLADRIRLPECPSITGPKGAESLVLQDATGPHFLVALPWSTRIRLSQIAQWSSVAFLVVGVLMAGVFPLRNQLDSLAEWLMTWSHMIAAGAILVVLELFSHLLDPSSSERKFSPPVGYMLIPPLLIMALDYFVKGSWLWIPLGILLAILWLRGVTIVLRCLWIAPTFWWRFALAMLAIGLTLPQLGLIRIAREVSARSAQRAETARSAAEAKRRAAIERFLLSHEYPLSHALLEGHSGSYPALEAGGSHVARPAEHTRRPGYTSHLTKEDYLRAASDSKGSLSAANQGLNLIDDAPPFLGGIDPSELLDARFKDGIYDIPGAGKCEVKETETGHTVRRVDPEKESDVVTWPIFSSKLIVLGVCVVLCWLAMLLGWMLDFAIDVLHYGGSERDRTLLIDRTANAIRWLHERAPQAPIIVVGHSLGSVISAHAVASLTEGQTWLRQLVLVTLGSPLNYLKRAFPEAVTDVRALSQSLCPQIRWINLWRRGDVIGKTLDIDGNSTVQYCVGRGGHANYWSDGEVWRAVARETLGVNSVAPVRSSGAGEFCLFERRLGVLVFTAITLLAFFGAGLWFIRF